MATKARIGTYIFSGSSGGLPQDEITFAKTLKAQGYSTAIIGKWHLGLNKERNDDFHHHPLKHGFDYFYGTTMTHLRDCMPGNGSVFVPGAAEYVKSLLTVVCLIMATLIFFSYNGLVKIPWRLLFYFLLCIIILMIPLAFLFHNFQYWNCFLMRNYQIIQQPIKYDTVTQRMTGEAVHFITRNKHKPFLLFMSYLQVHTALFASRNFRGNSKHGIYGDAVEEVDWSVGKIIDELQRHQLTMNTLVYFTSDNGGHLEEISSSGDSQGGWNGIYKAGKATCWEGGIRVPGLVLWPGVIEPGSVINDPTSNMDIFPTVVHLSGSTIPQDRIIDGKDLLPLVQGKTATSDHEFLFHYCNAYLHAIRWNQRNSTSIWKAFYFTPIFDPEDSEGCFHTHVCHCDGNFVTQHDPPLLFDLTRDPSEKNPLTPKTEPNFYNILNTIQQAKESHQETIQVVDNQLSWSNVIWKPWLQACCSSWSEFCYCDNDEEYRNGLSQPNI
ncbi:steryl-sulfatase isoform X2 [Hyperolius riggenbachi]